MSSLANKQIVISKINKIAGEPINEVRLDRRGKRFLEKAYKAREKCTKLKNPRDLIKSYWANKVVARYYKNQNTITTTVVKTKKHTFIISKIGLI